MTNSEHERGAVTRGEAFQQYLACHVNAGAAEGQVRRAARCVLTGAEARAESFTVFPFYSSALESVTNTHCTHGLTQLSKAAELLEIICLNLLLYPWRKEIRTLKKFTGQFVYYIQPVLPSKTIKSVLQSIGYSLETETEYKLSDDADPEKAKVMAFELFLARLECENLLEVMGQRSHADCLEIIRKRAASLSQTNLKHNVNVTEAEAECVKVEDLEEPKLNGGSLTSQGHESLQSLRPTELEVDEPQNAFTAERKSSLSDDGSIMEMQKNYPDLAIRQKFIFKKPQRTPASPKNKDWACRDSIDVRHLAVDTDLSGPQSIAFHSESTTPGRKQVPEPQSVEDKRSLVLRVEAVLKPGFVRECFQDEGLVTDLTGKMSKLQMKELSADEPLKYPIEETAQAQQCPPGCQDYIAITPPPVEQSPSQQLVCNLTGCGGCSGSSGDLAQDDPIKEPPHSFYIPNCLTGCSPTQAPPSEPDQNCGDSDGQQLHRSPTQQPEDELIQTYVML